MTTSPSKPTAAPPPATAKNGEAILHFTLQAEWALWLSRYHTQTAGVWLRHAKKGAPTPTVSYAEALEVALCFGWIDSQKNAESDHFFIQRWSPRGPRSIWSQINKDKVMGYIASGHMQPAGLAEIERAKKDGRWDAAYQPASKSDIPPDLQAAFDAHPGAAEFFATVSAQNRYAVLFRLQNIKKPETRERRIKQFAQMLARGETVYPQTARKAKPA